MPEDRQSFGEGQDDVLRGVRDGLEAARRFQAASAVKAGVEGGKAVSEIAAGTAAGGPWGAAISAAWSLRHTLFKLIVCFCLFVLFVAVLVTSLPSIVTGNFNGSVDLSASFDDYSAIISACIEAGHEAVLAKVDQIITDGNYDHDLSISALDDQGKVSPDYDSYYILAAYSVSMGQTGTSKDDFQAKLQMAVGQMYQVTYVEREQEQTKYAACTIHPFDQSAILEAFGIDLSAPYGQSKSTYGEVISTMSKALKMTMYGTVESGMVPEITDADLNAYLNTLTCSGARKELIRAALSLVGKVPYFWGGKSGPGWNDAWNTPRLVTAAGSKSTGTIRPYGLDCTGFTDWVYQTALGVSLYEGSWRQWDNTYAITEAQLLPGDLGFMAVPGTVPVNHTLLYAGKDAQGRKLWIHCSSGSGVVMNSPTYVTQFRRPIGVNLEADLLPAVS